MAQATFESLRKIAYANGNASVGLIGDVQRVIDGAEQNALDTPGEDFAAIALGSICFTSEFNEISAVRGWFEANGYRW